ncbi:MAG: hypothetical protein ACYC28_12605 [Longimicrobiales bacterium]
MALLPEQYRILPYSIDFRLPGYSTSVGHTLALRKRECVDWLNELERRVQDAIADRTFMPVCRMSDGEFKFVVGEQPESVRLPVSKRLRRRFWRILFQVMQRGGFGARTRPGVPSGRYSRAEWQRAQSEYSGLIRQIAGQGILALHLSYGAVPFQEHYFRAFGEWMREHDIQLNDDNYYPFYFVYALLSGPSARRLVEGRRILLVNAADAAKRQRIKASLFGLGAREIYWKEISAARSLFDTVDVSDLRGRVDLAFVGAGVGKPKVLLQLAPLGVPAIDAGYMFEVWADPSLAPARAFCSYDPALAGDAGTATDTRLERRPAGAIGGE